MLRMPIPVHHQSSEMYRFIPYINTIKYYNHICIQEIMINQCESCHYNLFDNIGTQHYCLTCDRINHQLQEEVIFVPAAYSSNSKNKKELELQRKINRFIRQFYEKYNEVQGQEQMEVLRARVKRIQSSEKYSKCTREATAAVVFSQLREQMQQTNIKEFCRRNNIAIRRFNAKYKLYYKLYVQQAKREQPLQPVIKRQPKRNDYSYHEMIKVQQKHQEQPPSHHHPSSYHHNMLIQQQNDGYLLNFDHEISSCSHEQLSRQEQDVTIPAQLYHDHIMVIYDDVFANYYLRNKKKHVAGQLIRRLQGIEHDVLEEIRSREANRCLRAYYLIYAVLRALGNKFCFPKYNEIVNNRTGFILKAKVAHDIQKVLQDHSVDPFKTHDNQSHRGIKIEQKYWQINQITVPFQLNNLSSFQNEDEFFK